VAIFETTNFKIPKLLLLLLLILPIFLIGNIRSIRADTKSSTSSTMRNIRSSLFFLPQSSKILAYWYSPPKERFIRFWSLENGKLVQSIPLDRDISSMAVSNDERLIAFGTYYLPSTIECYSVKGNRWLWKDKWEEAYKYAGKRTYGVVEKIIFSPNDRMIIALGKKQLVIFDAKDGNMMRKQAEPLNEYPPHIGCENGYEFSPDGRYLGLWHGPCLDNHGIRRLSHQLYTNKKITIWDVKKNEMILTWERDSELCTAAFSPDGREMVIGLCDGHILVNSLSENKIIRRWLTHTPGDSPEEGNKPVLFSLSFSKEAKYIATYGRLKDGLDEVKVWNYEEGKLLRSFHKVSDYPGPPGKPYPMAFSPDGKYFALEQQGNLCLYDTQTWQEKWCVPSWEEGK
jgi:WD40 repeat protein